ncbi:hypothetical protein ACWEKT_32200 [Nocardia takedensis]
MSGRLAGAVLAEIRRSTARESQDAFAERLGISSNTVTGWETGGKPLVRLPFTRLRALQRTLVGLGASAELMSTWESALAVDELLAALHGEPEQHPLAHTVPDRATSELIAWAITGQIPRALRSTGVVLRIGRGERDALVRDLCDAADRAPRESSEAAQLQRQTMYLVAGDPGSQPWIADKVRRTMHYPRGALAQWSPRWALARSAAVSAAAVGDPEPLERFIAVGGLDDRNALINLTYWAYWSGDITETWAHDDAMTRMSASWSGERLLDGLLTSILDAPYRELSVHTLWALLTARRQLAADPRWRQLISSTVETALTADHDLSATARRYLDQVLYLVRSE